MPDPEHGQPGHVVVFDDVTMLDQAQRQAAWAELARRLAHEIKNPLTPIRLAAERLQIKLEGALDPDRAQLLDRATRTIIHQVDALRNMVDAFGDYARPGATRREALNLDALISAVRELWSAGDSGVRFELQLDHGERQPLGDPGQFQQILNNLVQNAREAHPEGRPVMTIRTGIESADDQAWLRIDVEDNGPGFDPVMLARVFEPYVSSKPRGTGLGLAIVQRMVDLMGGRIEAENASGGGARIRIELPLPTTAGENRASGGAAGHAP
jgi:nitrogen fixation/metabolism regulation signal transduction histidine kinase